MPELVKVMARIL